MIRIWDAQTGSIVRSLQAPQSAPHGLGVVETMAFSPDGKTLVVAYWDGVVRYWNVADGKLGTEFPHADQDPMNFNARMVTALAFTADGKTLITAGFDGEIKFWNAEQVELLVSIQAHEDHINGFALAKSGRQIVSCSRDGRVKVWDVVSRQEIAQLGDELPANDRLEPILATAWSPDGRWMASAHDDRSVRVRAAADGRVAALINGHDDLVAAVAFSPDSRLLATASCDRTIKLWDLGPLVSRAANAGNSSPADDPEVPLKIVRTLTGHGNWVMAATFSPNGKWLLSGSYARTARIWNVGTGKMLAELAGHTAAVRSVAFSPDNQSAATGSSDRTAKLWNIATRGDDGQELSVVQRVSLESPTRAIAIGGCHDCSTFNSGVQTTLRNCSVPGGTFTEIDRRGNAGCVCSVLPSSSRRDAVIANGGISSLPGLSGKAANSNVTPL